MKVSYLRIQTMAFLCAIASQMTAQDLNTAYFTDDFFFRHDMNPAFANEKSYISMPALGNLNVGVQGNLGIGDVLFTNPDPTGKKTVTFMHPSISYDEALKGISDDGAKLRADLRLTILSAGFKAFGGYNTIELSNRMMAGLSLPRSLFEFAKGPSNKEYTFDEMAVRGLDYVELALGHSHDINDKLRIGAKAKVLVGIGRADLSVTNMKALLVGDTWQLQGQATGELNLKGATFKRETKEYKARPGTYEQVNDIDTDDLSLPSGTGFALDLGAVYRLNDDLTLSAALTDLGFISWSTTAIATNNGQPFIFDGFHDIAMRDEYAGPGEKAEDQADSYADQFADFIHLNATDDTGSKSTALAATARLGVEYQLPMYRKLSAGLLFSHQFAGSNFSWTETRLSANWKPLKWIDGGVSVALGNYANSFGWVLNIHPKGFSCFIGMDRLMTKKNDDFIPLSPNANLALGFNIPW